MSKDNLKVKPRSIKPALENSKFVSEIPAAAGRLVSTLIFKERLYITCESAVFRLEGAFLVQLKFKL